MSLDWVVHMEEVQDMAFGHHPLILDPQFGTAAYALTCQHLPLQPKSWDLVGNGQQGKWVRDQLCYEDGVAWEDDACWDVNDVGEVSSLHQNGDYWLRNWVWNLCLDLKEPSSRLEYPAGIQTCQRTAAVAAAVGTEFATMVCTHNELAVGLEANSGWADL